MIGFGAEVQSKLDKTNDELLQSLMPQDLLKYGLIPEFIGRLPVVVTLDNLDEDAFVHILTEPKNALTKQYEYLFALDDVILEFKEEALRAIARKAMERETGARGLRSIVEEFINPIMYEIPTQTNVERCIITEDVVNGKAAPEYVYNENRKPLQRDAEAQKQQRKQRCFRINQEKTGKLSISILMIGILFYWKNAQ